MVAWDPFFGICLCTSCSSGTISIWLFASNVDLLDWCSDTFATSFLLREIGDDPDAIEGIANTSDGCGENKVKKDAREVLARRQRVQQKNTHLRVEDAGIGLDNLNSTIKGLLGEELVTLADDSCQIQT